MQCIPRLFHPRRAAVAAPTCPGQSKTTTKETGVNHENLRVLVIDSASKCRTSVWNPIFARAYGCYPLLFIIRPELQRGIDEAESRHGLAGAYLKQPGVTLQTTGEFVNNAFVLCEVLKDVLDEAETDAITINSCMGTIMPMSQTTACLPLSLLNDDGYLAFCESGDEDRTGRDQPGARFRLQEMGWL
jgi:hypothetical protein